MFAIGGLGVVATAVAVLTTWAIYTHATWRFAWGHETADRADQSYLGRGFRILTQHAYFKPGAAIAIAAVCAAVALIVLMRRHRRWAYVVTAAGCSLAIVPPWLLRSQVWDIEAAISRNVRWAMRSPYVTRATNFAILVTIVLGLIAIAALVAFVTSRPPKQPLPPT